MGSGVLKELIFSLIFFPTQPKTLNTVKYFAVQPFKPFEMILCSDSTHTATWTYMDLQYSGVM